MQHVLRVTQLNAVPAAYAPILRLQELLFEQRKAGLIPDTLLMLEVGGPDRPTRVARQDLPCRAAAAATPSLGA